MEVHQKNCSIRCAETAGGLSATVREEESHIRESESRLLTSAANVTRDLFASAIVNSSFDEPPLRIAWHTEKKIYLTIRICMYIFSTTP